LKAYTATSPTGEALVYVDRKRRYWALATAYPLQGLIGIALHGWTGNEAWIALPFFVIYVVGPLFDWIFGEDKNNPPEIFVQQLESDPYYRFLTIAIVPVHYFALIIAAWWVATQDLSIWGYVGVALIAGASSGLAINTGHELGHKKSKLERTLAKFVLAIPVYGHFSLEHNRGHHRDVSTPADPASARMGENIYRFALREIPGAFRGAWRTETERLNRRELPTWSLGNQIVQSWIISAVLQLGIIVFFGYQTIAFLVIHNLFAWWQLTSANYVEHYGLLRNPDENGRYERCQPHHSWNSNHICSNLALFHLQRHSDHHAHPLRRYQSLRHYNDLPSLPTGYFGTYLLAYVPWLWYRVIDKRLLALPHINGDLRKVNVDPKRKNRIMSRYAQGIPK